MPYIPEAHRKDLIPHSGVPAETPGDLNFQLTRIMMDYYETHDESYRTYNDCLGALEGCKLELYRRKIAPYEDLKCGANGDVYYV